MSNICSWLIGFPTSALSSNGLTGFVWGSISSDLGSTDDEIIVSLPSISIASTRGAVIVRRTILQDFVLSWSITWGDFKNGIFEMLI